MSTSKALFISQLRTGLPGVSPARASEHVEACIVCLSSQHHTADVRLKVEGDFTEAFAVVWDASDLTEQVKRSWEDEEEATESGACCLAFLLVLELTPYTVIRRSIRGTGFDYWLGDKHEELLFQDEACLEVSGIRHAIKKSDLDARIRQKTAQVQAVDDKNLKTYIIVVDFGAPSAYILVI